MTMDKQTNIPLETTAKYQPLSNLDVNFYTRDIQTSILNFIVTRNHKPLLLGESNVVTNISLEFEDGSIVRDDLTIKDGINGILSYTLSDEMLRHTGKVTGQVDIAIKGKEDTVVERLFSFNIAKTLIDSIDAETKLIHIKRFSDLEKNITERYERMEETFANGESLVQAVLDASTKGLDDLTSAKNKSLNEIKTSKANTLKEITNTGSNYTNQLNTVYNTMDEKINKFNTDVQSGGYVKSSITDNWQKYKLTNDDGSRTYVQGLNLHEAPPGQYESTQTVNGPLKENGEPDTGFIEADISVSSNGRRLIMATRSSFNKTYVKTLHTNGIDTGWKELTNNQTDTGWIPFTIINGGRTNPAYDYGGSRNGYGCSYRTITTGSKTEKYIRVNADNIAAGQVIAQLPEGFAKNPQVGFIRAPLAFNGTSLIIEKNGEVKAYINNSSEWTASEGNYIYGTISWVE